MAISSRHFPYDLREDRRRNLIGAESRRRPLHLDVVILFHDAARDISDENECDITLDDMGARRTMDGAGRHGAEQEKGKPVHDSHDVVRK
jgi:hypothetical protein